MSPSAAFCRIFGVVFFLLSYSYPVMNRSAPHTAIAFLITLIIGAGISFPAFAENVPPSGPISLKPSDACTPLLECHGRVPVVMGPLQVTIEPEPLRLPLIADEPVTLKFKLKDNKGRMITSNQLGFSHTKKIHLMAIDPTMTDYHHLHPVTSKTPGIFQTEWAPETPGPYRLFLESTDVQSDRLITGVLDVGGTYIVQPITDRPLSTQAQVDGYNFHILTATDVLSLNTPSTLRLQITKNDQAITNLEPIMGAFAHLVGFTSDGKEMVHMHPMSPEPKSETDRGGPELQFHIKPTRFGKLPLFLQVKIDDKTLTVPFMMAVSNQQTQAEEPMSHHH